VGLTFYFGARELRENSALTLKVKESLGKRRRFVDFRVGSWYNKPV
jgi:hypothetical protein